MDDLRVQHIGVDNETAQLNTRAPFSDFEPCAVLAIRRGVLTGVETLPITINVHGTRFERRHGGPLIGVYLPPPP